ncbi:MAG: prephenate dehydratase [Fusobacteriaceae bacterium]
MNKKIKVGYQGVEGSFSHIATCKLFGEEKSGQEKDEYSYLTWEEIFIDIEKKKIDFGVVPIENSSTGEIAEVLDLLKKYNCFITKMYPLKVEQHLLGIKGSKLEDIKDVYSHPQGFLQSRKFLNEKKWNEIPLLNTAVSAKFVSEQNDKTKAAIGSYETAALYNLDILAEKINTNDKNYTKFIVISSEHENVGDNFSLILTLEHKVGALMKAVNIIGENGFNMLNIKSRPVVDVPWEYYFYIEIQGEISKKNLLLSEFDKNNIKYKLLGQFSNY